MAIADVSDVTDRWGKGEQSPEISTLIGVRLNDVERLIKRRIKDLEDRVVNGDIDPEDVKQVEADAVLRLVRNVDGFLTETDGNYSYTLQRELASGRLEILPDEWETLGINASSLFFLTPNLVRP